MPEVSSAEGAAEIANALLTRMGHTVYSVFEIIPEKEAYEDVWLVRAATIAGKLEIVIRKKDGTVMAVRRKT